MQKPELSRNKPFFLEGVARKPEQGMLPNGTPPPEAVTQLVLQAQAGERRAFEELVQLHHERIFRMAWYRLRSKADAEDVVQDVFLKAFRKLSGLEKPERFGSWLSSIAFNAIRDEGRKRKLRTLFFLERKEDEPSPGEEGGKGEKDAHGTMEQVLTNDFWRHVERLSEVLGAREKEIFMLRFLDGLEIKEIAETIGRSEGTVKTSLHRAVMKFRKDGTLRDFLHERAL